ncbi:glycosyltransferase family protein [Holzapfeliella sp. JNUCC 72]
MPRVYRSVRFFILLIILIYIANFLPKIMAQFQSLPYPGKLTMIVSLFLVILLAGIVLLAIKFRQTRLTTKAYWYIVFGITGIAFVWQLFLIHEVALDIEGWDPWTIFQWITGNGDVYPNYFSYNPNNMMTMYMYQFTNIVTNLFGRQLSWLALDRMNMIVILIASLLFAYIAKKLLSSIAALFSVGLFSIYFTFSPLSVVPYSDTLSLLPALLTIVLLLLAKHYQSQKVFCALLVVVAGLMASVSYYTKASSVIFFIAFLLASAINLLKTRHFSLFKIELLGCLLVGFLAGFYGIKKINQVQTIVAYNSTLATPMTHYLAIGASEKGWWNQPDQDFTRSFESYSERSQKNMDKFVQRVTDRGWDGYIDFLKYKNAITFNDGTLGWYEEGGGKVVNDTPSKANSEKNNLRKFLYGQGSKTAVTKWFAQVIWLVLWIIVTCSIASLFRKQTSSLSTDWLTLTVLGGFIFLSLFESGRGRYVIQFLPYYFLLAGYLVNNFKSKIKKHTQK